MTLIFSEANDQSTNYIIDWFIYYQYDFIRDNGNTECDSIFNYDQIDFIYDFESLQFSLEMKDKLTIQNKTINSVWYRRTYVGVENLTPVDKIHENSVIPINLLKNNLLHHNYTFKDLFIDNLKEKRKLGEYKSTNLNKAIVLNLAKQIGLKIPNSIITNSKESLKLFLKANDYKIITKPLYEVIYFSDDDFSYITLTTLITNLSDIPDLFSVSLFQNYIDKKYEIRTFFLDGNCYSMAIFSQNNSKTKIDFRDYDNNKMNRMIPYKLNMKIERKINRLMKKLKLNSGSIDLIRSKDGNYYFLEINPLGQFDFLSKSCNYNLEKKLAKHLIN